jgi:GTP cyclohydrolase I
MSWTTINQPAVQSITETAIIQVDTEDDLLTVKNNIESLPISTVIRNRIIEDNGSFLANDNISDYIYNNELQLLIDELTEKQTEVLKTLIIDVDNDHNTRETASRIAKMTINEIYKGRYYPKPSITDFPNAKSLDEMYTVGPITVRSSCSHHFLPIIGKAWIGILPSNRVIGLSKFNRISDWIMSRPHIQEEAVIMLADEIEESIKPKGLFVFVEASHSCMTMRGVKDTDTLMTNAVIRGVYKTDPSAKSEFYNLIGRK